MLKLPTAGTISVTAARPRRASARTRGHVLGPPRRRRRGPRDQQRLVGRPRPARRHARPGARRDRGLHLGRLHVHGATSRNGSKDAAAKGADTVSLLTGIARQQAAVTAFEDALGRRPRRPRHPRLGQHARRRPDARRRFADAVAAAAKKLGRGAKVSVTVLDEKQLADLGCGGILGVGGGSAAPPRLVELTYAPAGAVAHLALVGKGITFDSGGLTIKPAAGMDDDEVRHGRRRRRRRRRRSRSPSSGCRSRSPRSRRWPRTWCPAPRCAPATCSRCTAARPSRCSTPTPRAGWSSPTRWSGPTEQKPDVIVDVATLTGHMVDRPRRPGRRRVRHRRRRRRRCSPRRETPARRIWPMPIPEAIVERVHGQQDRRPRSSTTGSAGAAALFAAAFLREFTAGLPWAHLDIAGPAFNTGGAVRPRHLRRHRLRGHHPRRLRRGRSADGVRRAGASSASAGRRGSRVSPAASCAGCSRASAAGCRPRRRRTTGPGACCRSCGPSRPTAPGGGSTRRRARPAAASRR